MANDRKEIAIVGCGDVGASLAYVMLEGFEGRVRILNRSYEKALGCCMDLNHAAAVSYGSEIVFTAHGLYEKEIASTANAVVITIGTGLNPQHGMTDRNQLALENARMLIPLLENMQLRRDAIILIITNPVDNLTFLARKILAKKGISSGQVIGLGTMVESTRFRSHLTKLYPFDRRSLGELAFVLGEHGETMVPISSRLRLPDVDEYLPDIAEFVRKAALFIRKTSKAGPKYCIASSAWEVIQNILDDRVPESKKFLTVSFYVDDNPFYGLSDTCLSLPAIVGPGGIEKIVEVSLSAEELKSVSKSADILRKERDELKKDVQHHKIVLTKEMLIDDILGALC